MKKNDLDWSDNEKLHLAVQDGDFFKVKGLIGQGWNINQFDDLGNTPLHYAVIDGNIAMAKYLLDCGANVNSHDESRIGNTPLGDVAENCTFMMANLLIEYGANPTIPGWMQLTPLHRAKTRKKEQGIRVYNLLLEESKKYSK